MPRILITEPDLDPQKVRIPLDHQETTIGRGADNNIILQTGSASTKHCVIKRVDGGFILEDLGSTNGIKHDNTRCQVIDLTDGITVQIGDIDMEFSLYEDEAEALSAEKFESHEQVKLPPVTPPPPSPPKPQPEPTHEKVPAAKEVQASHESMDEQKKGPNVLAMLIIALIAFAIGYGIRHFKETQSTPEPAPSAESVEKN